MIVQLIAALLKLGDIALDDSLGIIGAAVINHMHLDVWISLLED
jgi:hypothetical protein